MSLAQFALAPRERDVVAFASRGMPPATIAEEPSPAPSTVARYLSSVYAKVAVSSRDGLRDVVIDDLEGDAPSGPARNGEP
jgi:DNA-binding NarL/FixJ family response regulator